MKPLYCHILLLAFCWISVLAYGGDGPILNPEDIIRKSIDARGGKKQLAKFLNYRVRLKGLVFNGGQGAPSNFLILHRSIPKSYKIVGEVRVPEIGLINQTLVFNGKNVWKRINGETKDGSEQDLQDARLTAYDTCVNNLFLFLGKNQYALSLLPASKIKDKDVIAVSVSHKGYPDLRLYFDKESWLLAKSEYRIKMEPGSEKVHEEYFEGYKRLNSGVMFPLKKTTIINGMKRFEIELISIEPLTEVQDSEFDKP